MPSSRWSYGSQYQLNRWLQERESALVTILRERCETLNRWAPEVVWISPDFDQGGRESGDSAWHKVGLPSPSPHEAQWWPTSGPRWDAVARVIGADGRVGALFVEAKGRRGKVCAGRMDRRTPGTVEQRHRALAQVRHDLRVDDTADWTGPCYQVANRLAWLWFARRWECRELPVWLVSIYFCGENYPATGSGGRGGSC